MRGAVLAAVAVLLLTGPALARQSNSNTPPGATTATTVEQLDEQVRGLVTPSVNINSSRCGPTFNRLLAAGDNPLFDRLPIETRRLVLRVATGCSRRDPPPRAVALIRRLEPLAEAPDQVADANQILMEEAQKRKDMVEGARRLIRIIDADPDRVAGWWPPYLNQFINGEGVRDNPDIAIPLLQRLTAMTWRDSDSRSAATNYWAGRYGELLIDRGDVAGAQRVLAGMENTQLWMTVAQDRRYASLWAGFQSAGRFDWRKSVESELTANVARRAEKPKQLVLVYEALQLLRQLQRYDDAIALGQAWRARIKDGETFEDGEKYANWVLNELAYALYDTGRSVDGETVFLESIEVGEAGTRSVSQRINWAERLNTMGRPLEALAVLETLSPAGASPYGEMWASAGRVCALSQTGGEGTATALNTMRPRWQDNPSALTQALVCAGLLDEAAALYVKRLQSPKHRADVLEAFRVVLPPPTLTPRQVELERRRLTVLNRPDVQAALAAVGRAIDLPLAGAYWGSI
ncbi:MAG: hypothetical protein Q8L23_12915 [Caulobacter sp.]|nr:hypothetical protein [Caulobacter sp.]